MSRTNIRSMPMELLQEIFLLSISKGHWLGPHTLEHLPPFDTSALRIAAVCQAWRAISLALPELWCTMAIYDPCSMTVGKVQLYLSRAGTIAPFSLYLTHYRRSMAPRKIEDDMEEGRCSQRIIDLWFAHVQRWRSIYFEFRGEGPPLQLQNASPAQLKNLRDVGFSTTIFSATGFQEFWDKIHTSPNLRSIYWGRLPSAYPLSAPLKQLARITLNSASIKELYEVFRGCPLLEHLSILRALSLGEVERADLDKVILVPRLQSLHILESTLQTLPLILDNLVAPSLHDLAISNMPVGLPKDILKRFLARSKCTLKTLLFRESWYQEASGILHTADLGDDDDDDDDHEGQSYLHGLEKLVCQHSINWIELLQPIRNPRTGAPRVPFPSLLTLEAPMDRTDGVVGNTLLAREAAGSPLWNVTLERTVCTSRGAVNDQQPLDSHIFRDLERRGLKLSVNNVWYYMA